ncbi:ABC transporter ATP-binding protein [Seohaeicola zhoushanensis]|uniref:Glutathione import ATP-binding protein GsiA n=1 Tax=Seohaeicola zhoushanensis TaxID=1569283 RepID=A0A8J3M7Z3_9RHOB|nr:ABC transporter ATP-binding protein [Seohaeicola zhoushanensis]GHF55690.1 ATP-binding protein [Seohaeicola zhoushanensis]
MAFDLDTGQPLLSVRDLSTSFKSLTGWTEVIRDISFDLHAGETLALVGESGSGKSVTSLSIMRLNPAGRTRTSGQVLFEGQDLLHLSEEQMLRVRGNDIAMIFQEPMTSLNPVLSIGFQLGEALRLHRGITQAEAMKEAERLLERVRIPAARARLSDFPHNFSGGMRQRVMIAMALACGPRVLVADEPTTALDVTVQAQIIDLLKELQREEGMGILFITHDMGVVAEVADRTLVMYKGNMVECAPTREIFANPRQNYTRALISSVPRLGSMAESPAPRPFDVTDRETAVQSTPDFTVAPVRPDEAPVLEVEGLRTRFPIRRGLFGRLVGNVHAVENVSFDIRPGETLSLVGESGCGKSTTGRSVMRLVTPQAGSVRLGGQEMVGLGRSALRRIRQDIQMVFQDPFASLDPRSRVGSSIAEPMIVAGLDRELIRQRVGDLLEEVGLSRDMARRFPHEFSGGQRQRICIARALAVRPKVIVADEAVSALDVTIKVQIVNLLMELQARHRLSMLFISHDMAVVERVSHRVAVMYLGEIVEIGSRAAIFSSPQHAYTRQLLAAVPVADPGVARDRAPAAFGDLRNPVKPPGYEPPRRSYRKAGPDHLVRIDEF